MAIKIHPAVAKKARKLGLSLAIVENEIEVSLNGRTLASHLSAKTALARAEDTLANEAEAEAEADVEADAAEPEADEADDDTTTRSVIRKVYRQRYKPHGNTCGDDLSQQLAEYLKVETDDGVRVDRDKLKGFAVANGCWQDSYDHLNIGLQRMNVVNRLRAKIRKGWNVVWE